MSARVNFEVIAGQRRVSEVRVHGEGGEVLSGPEWTMYGGAICDGFAPVRMRCTEDGGMWRVVLPGLKRGAMPWRWQLFLQEVSTGVEWLVAEGEVRVRERRAEAVAPEDDELTELVCVLSADRTVFEVQLGDATAVAVAAAACAREAAEKAAEARAGAEGAVARHAGDAGVHVTETERKAWNTPLFNAAEAQLLQRLAVFAKGSDAGRASLAAGQRIVLTGGGNWLRLDGNGVHIANTQFPAYLKLGSDDDRLAVLPLGVKTAMGADGYGLSVSADGGLQLWGTHFLQGDAHADTTLKIVHNSLSLGSTDTAAIGFDYANTVTFRTFPNDGSTANDNAGGVYRFEAWRWADDSHTSKVEMAVDVRKPNAGTLCDESLMNRAEVLAAIEKNAPKVSTTTTVTKGSSDLVTSGAVYDAHYQSRTVSYLLNNSFSDAIYVVPSSATHYYAGGAGTWTTSYSVALGYGAHAGVDNQYATDEEGKTGAVAIGYLARALWLSNKNYPASIAIGYKAISKNGIFIGHNGGGVISNRSVIIGDQRSSAHAGEVVNCVLIKGVSRRGSNNIVIMGLADKDVSHDEVYATVRNVVLGSNCSACTLHSGGFEGDTTDNIVIGAYSSSSASQYNIVMGRESTAVGGHNQIAIGSFIKLKDNSTCCIGVRDSKDHFGKGTQTLLYLMGANSPLATTYEDGAACMGYVVKDTSGNILECGTRKLSEIFTNNTAFAPASMDLDAPAPTPFMPTGITDPIEFPQEPENEPEILTDTTQQ